MGQEVDLFIGPRVEFKFKFKLRQNMWLKNLSKGCKY